MAGKEEVTRVLNEMIENMFDMIKAKDLGTLSAFDKLIKGKSTEMIIQGIGPFHITYTDQKVTLQPGFHPSGNPDIHVSFSPKVLTQLLEGSITPLEVFFKNDFVVRSDSLTLHKLYDYLSHFYQITLSKEQLLSWGKLLGKLF